MRSTGFVDSVSGSDWPGSEATVLKTIFRSVVICTGLGLCLAASAIPAQADPVYSVSMTFQSGATFQGDITLSSGYNYIESVTGTLYGYSLSSLNGYVGGNASDPITWIWNEAEGEPNSYNYVTSGGQVYGTFLMDGSFTPPNSNQDSNWIDFSYSYAGSPSLTFAPSATLNDPLYPGTYVADGVDGGTNTPDPMVSGSLTFLSNPSAAPEPSPLSMLLLAAFVLGAAALGHRWAFQRNAIRS